LNGLLSFCVQDDGTPDQYDLPPPTAEGAISSENGAAVADGAISVDEQAQWIEKVGWAPRFGQGSITEAEAAESLLDHQTFLEGKLDDKFYGGKFNHLQG
jgi:hypothetical protein